MDKRQGNMPSSHTLLVDFTWKKFKGLVSAKDDPQGTPLYTVGCDKIKPKLTFRTPDNEVVGRGNGHIVNINVNCEVRGQPVDLKAMRRFVTQYTHQSPNFSKDGTPVPLVWKSQSDFKTWDFICVDPQDNPIAKYSANIWAVKKLGQIEFLGDRTAESPELREELMIMGLSMYCIMVYRTSSIFALFGAFIHKPEKIPKDAATVAAGQPLKTQV
jgi:hypothetical protein